ncbi:hypothetical protein LMH87_006384 [Akanthomyces muscarius]|uniref:Uncharacterized protein n=1 Tax=Akanthomyces muscarius TaxID=2231603 RepID=A0A9W8UQ86_AKAMU|nr:hypothetical protein LMH87_006384 [Akanthomyces muscarius]KAJ4164722.1 hypothetical protein LMH87_006384 [Akanthomyces muscarius]
MLKAAIIPRGGSEWRPSQKDELEFGVSARGQHQEFLVGLTADEEQQCRLPGFVRYANFRFRLHRQFEQIPETDFGGPDIWFHVLRITRFFNATTRGTGGINNWMVMYVSLTLDLSAEERQGHQSLEDVGSPNIDSLMGGAFEPYRNSLCVQHYHSHAVLVRVRLSKNST